MARQSTADLEDAYHLHDSLPDRDTYRLGDEFSFGADGDDTDVAGLDQGYITVTPLRVDMTDHRQLAALADLEWPDVPQAPKQ